jgi:hypothetical protein
MLFIYLYKEYLITGSRPVQCLLILSGLLAILSQILGVLLVVAVALHWLFIKRKSLFQVLVTFFTLAFGAIIIVALLSPRLLQAPFAFIFRSFDAFASTGNVQVSYSEPRGWTIIIAIKLAFLGFHSIFGQYTYPLDILITVPSATVIILLFLLGFFKLYAAQRNQFYLIIFCFLCASLVYFILDPLMPPQFTAGANVRLVIWIVPIFLWIVAEGIFALRRRSLQIAALIAVIAVQIFGITNMVTSAWAKADVSLVAETLKPYASQENTLIIADGRSSGFIEFNLQRPNNLRLIWDYHGQPDMVERLRAQGIDRVVVVSADFKESERCTYSDVLAQLREFKIVRGLVDYPYFIYEFDLTATPDEMLTPVSAFHMRYQDVRLPQTIVWEDNIYELVGMASLPDCHNQNAWQVALNGRDVQHVALFSHIVNRVSLTPETTVAKLIFITEDDERVEVAIKVGQHTQAWDALSEACQGCTSMFDWRKRAALVGTSGYDGAYLDFQARVWGAKIVLPKAIKAKHLSVETVQADATFNLWGLLVQ